MKLSEELIKVAVSIIKTEWLTIPQMIDFVKSNLLYFSRFNHHVDDKFISLLSNFPRAKVKYEYDSVTLTELSERELKWGVGERHLYKIKIPNGPEVLHRKNELWEKRGSKWIRKTSLNEILENHPPDTLIVYLRW